MADQHCPLCGRLNPETLETCRFCGARMKPLRASSTPPTEAEPGAAEEKQTGGSNPGNDSIPAWLKSLRDGVDSPPPGSEEKKSIHFGSSPEIAARQPKAEPQGDEKEKETPDWLAGLRSMVLTDKPEISPVEEEPSKTGLSALPDEASLPLKTGNTQENGPSSLDWLSQLREEPAQEPPQEAVPGGAIPDWIKELQPIESPSEEPAGEDVEDLPDWLSQLPSVDPVGWENGTAGAPLSKISADDEKPGTEQEIMDWISSFQSTTTRPEGMELQPGGTEPVDSAGGPGGEPGLTSTPRVTPLGEDDQEEEKGNETSVADTGEDIPDWFADLAMEEKQDEPVEEPTLENMGSTELPSWVQALRPVETILPGMTTQDADAANKIETMGPLAGLAGVLPIGVRAGSVSKPPVSSTRLQITSNQQKYAAALEKMVLEEGQARIRKPRGMNPTRLLRHILSIILVGVVLLPIISKSGFTPEMGLFPSEWEKTNQVIQSIPAGSPLLVVFDYDPALAGELEVAAAPVINHFLAHNAHLALISTNPTGPALGEKFLENMRPAYPGLDLAYTNLGYLAGGPTGMSLFSTNPRQAVTQAVDGKPAWDVPPLTGIHHLADFRAVIILTDNADTGRLWIEQTRASIGNTPLLMVVSAQAEPVIRPYFDSGQIQGLISGLMGGKTYEQTYATPGLARHYWDTFGIGITTIVILITVGSIWSAVKSLSARKKAGLEKP